MPPVEGHEDFFVTEPMSDEYYALRDEHKGTHTLAHLYAGNEWNGMGTSGPGGLLLLVPRRIDFEQAHSVAEQVVSEAGLVEDPVCAGLGGWYVTREEADEVNAHLPAPRIVRAARRIKELMFH